MLSCLSLPGPQAVSPTRTELSFSFLYFRFIRCKSSQHSEAKFQSHTYSLHTPWPESTSELYRPKYRRMSAKLVPNFADRGVSRCQRDESLRPYSRLSRPASPDDHKLKSFLVLENCRHDCTCHECLLPLQRTHTMPPFDCLFISCSE
jgi:hypothetical protein